MCKSLWRDLNPRPLAFSVTRNVRSKCSATELHRHYVCVALKRFKHFSTIVVSFLKETHELHRLDKIKKYYYKKLMFCYFLFAHQIAPKKIPERRSHLHASESDGVKRIAMNDTAEITPKIEIFSIIVLMFRDL